MLERTANTHVNADGSPKRAYPSRDIAKRAARRIRGHGGPDLWPYRCRGDVTGCIGWHLSGSPRRRTEA